jgi:hypothetical protein
MLCLLDEEAEEEMNPSGPVFRLFPAETACPGAFPAPGRAVFYVIFCTPSFGFIKNP